MNLVVGATGFLGSKVCRTLAGDGKPVTAMVRGGGDPSRTKPFEDAGVAVVEGDLKDTGSLRAACAGKTAVISTASSTISRQGGDNIQSVDLDGQKALIDAAAAEGVGRLVYISFSKNMDTASPLTEAKRTVEAYLRDSGVPYTILRCSFLMEVMLNPVCGFDYGARSAVLYGSGNERVSFVSMDDVARLISACVDDPAAANSVIEFGGPEPISLRDVVAVFEEVSGASFATQEVPEEALRGQMDEADDGIGKSMAAIMIDYAHGDVVDRDPILERFPAPSTQVRDYAAAVLSA